MAAFLQSGRSDTPKSGKTKVRFRPLAVVGPHPKIRFLRALRDVNLFHRRGAVCNRKLPVYVLLKGFIVRILEDLPRLTN